MLNGMTENERQVKDWLATQGDAMVTLLAELVNTDSGSYDKEGVDAAGEVLKRYFAAEGLALQTIAQARFGDQIKATLDHPTSNDLRPIILMGHRDTVFPKGEPQRRPFRIEDGRAYGPGVADMKAGLVMNAFVLAAFQRFGGAPVPAGRRCSPATRRSARRPADRSSRRRRARARAVLNAEPAGRPASRRRGRKGGVFMRLRGRRARPPIPARNFETGAAPIEELAHKILAFHALTDLDARHHGQRRPDRRRAVGEHRGARATWCEIDLRYVTPPDRDAPWTAIAEIVETCTVPGTTAQPHHQGRVPAAGADAEAHRPCSTLYHPPAARCRAFSVERRIRGRLRRFRLHRRAAARRSAAVGPVGGKAHTPDEFLEIDSMIPCAQALALSVMRLREGVLPPG